MYEGNKYSAAKIDYEKEGVAPPSVQLHEFTEPFVVSANWKQKGNYIYREGQELRYCSKIPTNMILTGTDNQGLPILKKIGE